LLIFATTWKTESEAKAGGKIEKIDPSEKIVAFQISETEREQ